MALIFTGDQFADGGRHIRQVLKKHNILASFFLTGNFYKNPDFHSLIKNLADDGHYLGAHSDEHLLYADWTKRDSLLIDRKEFKNDLHNNYKRMEAFGIKMTDAPYFLPPYEWYNAQINQWLRHEGLQLVNFSPGTFSAADYTYPEMNERYRSSDEIYQSIKKTAASTGLNGFMLLLHIGTDPRRKDKFYYRLDELINELSNRGYSFERIDELLN